MCVCVSVCKIIENIISLRWEDRKSLWQTRLIDTTPLRIAAINLNVGYREVILYLKRMYCQGHGLPEWFFPEDHHVFGSPRLRVSCKLSKSPDQFGLTNPLSSKLSRPTRAEGLVEGVVGVSVTEDVHIGTFVFTFFSGQRILSSVLTRIKSVAHRSMK